MSFLSTLNVMSGLVLAAIAPLALYPLDTKTLPAGPKRQMGDVFNVMAYAAVTTQISRVLFTHVRSTRTNASDAATDGALPCVVMCAALMHASDAVSGASPFRFPLRRLQVGNYQHYSSG